MSRNYYGRRNTNYTGVLTVILCVLLLALAIVIAIPRYFSEKNYTATVTGKDIKNYSSSSKFLIFTKLENGETRVFSMEDTLLKGRWDTADDYAEIEVGTTYTLTVIGWRIPFLSEYENIIEFQKTD